VSNKNTNLIFSHKKMQITNEPTRPKNTETWFMFILSWKWYILALLMFWSLVIGLSVGLSRRPDPVPVPVDNSGATGATVTRYSCNTVPLTTVSEYRLYTSTQSDGVPANYHGNYEGIKTACYRRGMDLNYLHACYAVPVVSFGGIYMYARFQSLGVMVYNEDGERLNSVTDLLKGLTTNEHPISPLKDFWMGFDMSNPGLGAPFGQNCNGWTVNTSTTTVGLPMTPFFTPHVGACSGKAFFLCAVPIPGGPVFP
jgi:hypothetical protein